MKQYKVCLECGAINQDHDNECLNCAFEDFVVCDGLDAAQEASEELRENHHE